ncbi:5576_t:CDS:1, partial [Acaulospora colombiana]
ALFLATLSAALLSYSNDIISNRGTEKKGDPFITGGFTVAISLCMGAALSSYLPTSGLFTSRHMLLLDRQKSKAFYHSKRILDGPLYSEATPKKQSNHSLPMLSKMFPRPFPKHSNHDILHFEVPLTSEELCIIRRFEQGVSVCQWVGESFLCLGFCVMFGTLVILSWTEQKTWIALLITVLLSLLVMTVLGVFWMAATSHMNLLIDYRNQSKNRTRIFPSSETV